MALTSYREPGQGISISETLLRQASTSDGRRSATRKYSSLWSGIDWNAMKRDVAKQQDRISRAIEGNDYHKANRLMLQLANSFCCKLLAVKHVTEENDGRKTPGVDGIANLTESEKFELASKLSLEPDPQPLRRAMTSKPNGGERELAIPVMYDRIQQAIVKMALEPEWRHKIHPNVYGSLPGRSIYDALLAVAKFIRNRPMYAIRTDIKDFFPSINYNNLTSKLHAPRKFLELIKGWLHAPIKDGKTLTVPHQGVPQGGVISPLLAHIAIHDLHSYVYSGLTPERLPLIIIYVDDILALSPDLELVPVIMQRLQEYLGQQGLVENGSKREFYTTLENTSHTGGVKFLGMIIRQFPGLGSLSPEEKKRLAQLYPGGRPSQQVIESWRGAIPEEHQGAYSKLEYVTEFEPITDSDPSAAAPYNGPIRYKTLKTRLGAYAWVFKPEWGWGFYY